MTSEHLRSVFTMYLLQWGKHYPAKKQDTATLNPRDKKQVLAHAMWMCEQSLEFLKDEQPKNVEKAMRWLGFVQGMLFFAEMYTIDDLRIHSTNPS